MTETSLKQRYMVITSLWEAGTHDADTLHDLTSIPLSTIYKYIKHKCLFTVKDVFRLEVESSL